MGALQQGSDLYKQLLEASQQMQQKKQERDAAAASQAGQTQATGIRQTMAETKQKLQSTGLVGQAQSYLQGAASGKPAFQSDYTGQIADLYDQIMNRPKFSYDPNKDPLYQNYRDQYMQNGQLAMRDAMGTAAGLTGGYGNSWGDTAGFQAYQAYLQQLGAVIPQLEQQAYERYKDEGTDALQKLSIAQEMEDADFAKYQSALAEWQSQQAQNANAKAGTAATGAAGTGSVKSDGYSKGDPGTASNTKTAPTTQNYQPTMQSILHTTDFSNMTDEQKRRIIREIEASLK